jgi:hypothetical protein
MKAKNEIRTKRGSVCVIDLVLYNWLKNKRINGYRVWGRYKKNIQNWGHYLNVDTIANSFPWYDTPENIHFWERLSNDFIRYKNKLDRKRNLFENS